MPNRTTLLLAGLAVAALALALTARAATMLAPLGADHPAHAVQSEAWPKGFAELINADSRVHGYWVNFEDVFFLTGAAADLNTFIKRCVSLDDVNLSVVLHPGRLDVQSPWDDMPRDLKADWRVHTSPYLITREAGEISLERGAFQITIDVWLGGQVSLDELDVPTGIEVRSGGEIETFIERHNAKDD